MGAAALVVKAFVGALSFLTRVPVRASVEGSPRLAGWVPWFAVVGALVGLAVAVVYLAARALLPPLAAAATAVAAGVALTGAFHEDGLGDVADAFGGGRERDEVLAILADPRHGTFGVVAIALSLILRVAALAALDGWAALAVLPAAHALSRTVPVALLGALRPAGGGLGASYGASVTGCQVVAGVGAGLVICAAGLGPWALAAGALSGLGALALGWLAVHKVGGITGDVLGASQQVAEAATLLLAAAVVHRGWSLLPWWS